MTPRTHTDAEKWNCKLNWNTNETTVARNKIDMMISAAALDSPCAHRFTAAYEGEVKRAKKWIGRSPPRSRNFRLKLLLLLFFSFFTHTHKHFCTTQPDVSARSNYQYLYKYICVRREAETGELLALLRPNCYDCNYEWTLLSRNDSEERTAHTTANGMRHTRNECLGQLFSFILLWQTIEKKKQMAHRSCRFWDSTMYNLNAVAFAMNAYCIQ